MNHFALGRAWFQNPFMFSTTPSPPKLIEGIVYYWENGLMVFTSLYHLKRGYCCDSGCRHCPYKKEKE